jgi:predicted nucleotidyltransferase
VAKVIEERVREREEAVRGAREFAVCVSQKLGKVTAILFGSFARGDFNVWSDIDVLIVAENLPQKPLERLSTIDVCLSRFPRVEPILITIEEFVKMKKKSVAVIEAVERGIVLLDMLNLISTA